MAVRSKVKRNLKNIALFLVDCDYLLFDFLFFMVMDLVIYSGNVAAFCFEFCYLYCTVLHVVDILVCLSVLLCIFGD